MKCSKQSIQIKYKLTLRLLLMKLPQAKNIKSSLSFSHFFITFFNGSNKNLKIKFYVLRFYRARNLWAYLTLYTQNWKLLKELLQGRKAFSHSENWLKRSCTVPASAAGNFIRCSARLIKVQRIKIVKKQLIIITYHFSLQSIKNTLKFY